mgnify:CR=1 FL=1
MLNKFNSKKISFHHYGLALKSFHNAIYFYQNLGYKCGKEVVDLNQNVRAILCSSNNLPSVELVKSLNKDSPLENYLKKSNEIIYHVCYEVESSIDLDSYLFSKMKYICVSKPKPAILFNNRNVSFYYIKHIGLIEILEK